MQTIFPNCITFTGHTGEVKYVGSCGIQSSEFNSEEIHCTVSQKIHRKLLPKCHLGQHCFLDIWVNFP